MTFSGVKMRLGSELKRLRKQKRLTLAEVSKQSGLSVSFLSGIERSRTNPSLDTLEKLAALYDVPISMILGVSEIGDSGKVKNYPEGFEDFRKALNVELDEELEDLLLRAETRSKRSIQTKEDWFQLYYSLKSALGEYN